MAAISTLVSFGVIVTAFVEVISEAVIIPLNGRDFPIKEYCDSETFIAECHDDEVVVITSAWYGRHSIGRCVEGNYGSIGCKSDVITAVDTLCSGQQRCEFEVDDDNFKLFDPCPKDFKSHLRVSYTCVKVNKPSHPCRGMTGTSQDSYDVRHISTSSTSPADLFISSDITRTTGCGAADFPWILEAPEGQKIGLSIVDFSLNGTKPGAADAIWNPLETGVCLVYASVRDGKQTPGAQRRTSTICGRLQPRMRHVFTSSSNYIELRILQSDVMGTSTTADHSKRPRFLVVYEVVGCSEPPIPAGGWAKRLNDNTVAVGCQDRPQQELWRLHCEISNWRGQMGNCTSTDSPYLGHLITSVQGLPFGLSVALVVAIAFVISCLILLVGICIITRRHSRKRAMQESQASQYGPQTQTRQSTLTNEMKSKYHVIKPNQSDNMYTDSDSVSKSGQTSGVTDLYTLRSGEYGMNADSYPGYRRQSSNRNGDYYPGSEHIYEYPTPENMGIHYVRQGSGQSDISSHSVHSGQYFDIDPNQIAGPVAIMTPEVPSGARGPVVRASCGHVRPCTCTGGHMTKPTSM